MPPVRTVQTAQKLGQQEIDMRTSQYYPSPRDLQEESDADGSLSVGGSTERVILNEEPAC